MNILAFLLPSSYENGKKWRIMHKAVYGEVQTPIGML